MRIIVSAPDTYEPERRYVLATVLSDRLGLEWELRAEARTDVLLTVAGDSGGCSIAMPDVLFGTSARDWLQPSSLPVLPLVMAGPMDACRALPTYEIPVLFGRALDRRPIGTRSSVGISLDVDVFGSVFYLLTRYEEMVAHERDEHERTLEATSVAVRGRFHHLPLADLYVELLWRAISDLWPGARRREQRYEAILTHDVDLVFACHEGTGRVLHAAAADVLRRRDLALAARRLALHVRGCDAGHTTDLWNVFGFMMAVAERNGRTCAFYFRADSGGPRTRYTLDEPWIRALLVEIHERGHEIGLHGGYQSYVDRGSIANEFARLTTTSSACGIRQDRWGGRQHFLRWENPLTWRAWDGAGIAYDSTVGYARNIGFRAGTCHPYRVYDLVLRRPLELRERPLIAMDTWLFHESANLDRAAQVFLDASRTCRQFNGEFVGLWHNNALASTRRQRWYAELVPQLV